MIKEVCKPFFHCAIRSPREERLYYNLGAKGYVPREERRASFTPSDASQCPRHLEDTRQ